MFYPMRWAFFVLNIVQNSKKAYFSWKWKCIRYAVFVEDGGRFTLGHEKIGKY